jgi:uncharacterized protein (DUF427 family)
MLKASPAIVAAREKWAYRGQERPPFAEPVGPGELSVWDFPRPPLLEPVPETLRVLRAEIEVAHTVAGSRVLETAGAPTYYFPPADVRQELLVPLEATSICEWKGIAASFALVDDPSRMPVAWSYVETFEEFSEIQGWFAFYPGRLSCYLGLELVAPQPGGYYGGWVTKDLKGPIKGEAGTGHW